MWKNRMSQSVQYISNKSNAGAKILVNFCNVKVNKIWVRVSIKSCAVRVQKGGGMQLASSKEKYPSECKRCNTAPDCVSLKTVI